LGKVVFLNDKTGHIETRYSLEDPDHGLATEIWGPLHSQTTWGSSSSSTAAEVTAKLKQAAKVGGERKKSMNFSISLEELYLPRVPLIKALKKSPKAIEDLQEQANICEKRKDCHHLAIVSSVVRLQEESKASSSSKKSVGASADVDIGSVVGVDIGVGPKVGVDAKVDYERKTTSAAEKGTVVAYLLEKVSVSDNTLDEDALKLLRECTHWTDHFSLMCQECNSLLSSRHIEFGVG
jgi:hypothetical protein